MTARLGVLSAAQGMAAGDNTLEALLARRVINVTGAASGQFDRTTMQQDYIQFMTTPDTHNDTYITHRTAQLL